MFFGLPLRVVMTATESVIMPLYWLAFQFGVDQLGLDQPVDVGRERERHDVGAWPAATARLWSPEAPYDWVNVTFLPAAVSWNALMSCGYAACGVE